MALAAAPVAAEVAPESLLAAVAAGTTAVLTAESRESTDEALEEVLAVSEELAGGEPGGVVLKGRSTLNRELFSVLIGANEGFGRPVSSMSFS